MKEKKNGPRWDIFFYHVAIFIAAHILFVLIVGIVPLSELGAQSYIDYILDNFLSDGVSIYQSEKINLVSKVWKTILIIHLIVELVETLFPSKKKSAADQAINEKKDALIKVKTNLKNTKSGSTSLAWVYLIIAGLLEIIWATALKMDMLGGPIIIVLILSFDLLIRAVKQLGVGTSYAVFTGIGVVGMVIVDFVIFEENLSFVKIVLVMLLVLFIIGLRFSSDEQEETT